MSESRKEVWNNIINGTQPKTDLTEFYSKLYDKMGKPSKFKRNPEMVRLTEKAKSMYPFKVAVSKEEFVDIMTKEKEVTND